MVNQQGNAMKAPADWAPTFSIFVSETAQRPVMGSFVTLQTAVEVASGHLRKFVIRRSIWTVMGERPRGMVVHTQR